jgi:excisionase family DNA binding protein
MDHHTFIWVATPGAVTARPRPQRDPSTGRDPVRSAVRGRLVDRSEAADRLGVSTDTVRRLARDGYLSEIRVGRRAVRIPEGDVDRHIARRRIVRDAEGGTAA